MKQTNYSDIINAENYNRIMNDQHLYISDTDQLIIQLIEEQSRDREQIEVVELGCGPGRVLEKIPNMKGVNFTGVDIDPNFLAYARSNLPKEIDLIQNSVLDYAHSSPVDIFFSQGFHHHFPKGEKTTRYLQNVASQLTPNGIYILSDEFLPEYNSEDERKLAAIRWYAHIIESAQRSGFDYLAQEEAKTLLDDLQANHDRPSRGDFKICQSKLEEELQNTRLEIKDKHRIGPRQDIGGMEVYVLGVI